MKKKTKKVTKRKANKSLIVSKLKRIEKLNQDAKTIENERAALFLNLIFLSEMDEHFIIYDMEGQSTHEVCDVNIIDCKIQLTIKPVFQGENDK